MPCQFQFQSQTKHRPNRYASLNLSIYHNPCPSVRPSIHAEKKPTNIHPEKPRRNANKKTASLVVLGCRRSRRRDNIIQPLSKEEQGRQHCACTLRNAIPSAHEVETRRQECSNSKKGKPVYKNHP
jgi:hypothetical protein